VTRLKVGADAALPVYADSNVPGRVLLATAGGLIDASLDWEDRVLRVHADWVWWRDVVAEISADTTEARPGAERKPEIVHLTLSGLRSDVTVNSSEDDRSRQRKTFDDFLAIVMERAGH
jgi:hypothetical protein